MANTPAPANTGAPASPTPPASSTQTTNTNPTPTPVEALNNPLIGKYIFLYDYQTTIYTLEARQIIAKAGTAKYTLPEGSSYKLKYSKGDVVDVINLGRPVSPAKTAPLPPSPKLLVINVPKFVTPSGGTKGFSKIVTIDNTNGFLKKVDNSTPVTVYIGTNFGKNPNPKAVPEKPKANTPKTNTTPPASTGNAVSNQGADIPAEKGFFESRNNLIMVGVVLVVGYLLFNSKSE